MKNYYSQENHGPFQLYDIGSLQLEEGGQLDKCELAVATYGTLNEAKDNAILITTWYSGTSKIMEQVYIGEEHTLDPNKYFIIVVNQIGSGLSTSPSNYSGEKTAFPKVRITDDVNAQYKLLTEHFGITSLALVMGGSMGAQQTYEWIVRYPNFVKRAAAMAGTAKNSEHDFLYAETLIEAITDDPGFQQGRYSSSAEVSKGLSQHAKLWTVMGWSTEFFRLGRHKELGFSSLDDFYQQFMVGYFADMDPNNLLCMAWKWQRADVSRHENGDLAKALAQVKAKVFVMPISHDMFFSYTDCLAEQKLIPNSEFRPLQSIDGHLGLFGTDPQMVAQVDNILAELLNTEMN